MNKVYKSATQRKLNSYSFVLLIKIFCIIIFTFSHYYSFFCHEGCHTKYAEAGNEYGKYCKKCSQFANAFFVSKFLGILFIGKLVIKWFFGRILFTYCCYFSKR